MPQTSIARGNELYDWIIGPVTVTWSAQATTVAATELTCTVPGLNAGDQVSMSYSPPAGTAVNAAMPYGLSYDNIRVATNNTLSVLWTNTTAGGLTPPTTNWYMTIVRPENPNNLPPSAAA